MAFHNVLPFAGSRPVTTLGGGHVDAPPFRWVTIITPSATETSTSLRKVRFQACLPLSVIARSWLPETTMNRRPR
ncbi:hypothetical protein [Nonomuraea sp. B1E8]|uniref:hypothetical protein n=1 Tax=unclassified Nonomuraea TaxID=2593643 RepID=UPI00325F7723